MSSEKKKVAVIGCGPGAMFFCHALETHRRELMAKGDEQALQELPSVTVFERASGPGGVWRAKRSFGKQEDEKKTPEHMESTPSLEEEETTNMYEALWLNGCKEPIEFFDYTFDEHFEHALPAYLPRQAYLDYMLGRVTKYCPDFFCKYVKFQTRVVSVESMEEKFKVTIKDWTTQTVSSQTFDYCIWAAGQNGRANIPSQMVSTALHGFSGRILHSSDTANFKEDVQDKRVLLIGGGYSAEDLALMAIKVGASRIYISSRGNSNVVTWTTAWPQNKVELLNNQTPVRVTDNGRCIEFSKPTWNFPNSYKALDDTQEVTTKLYDIDTIIFCTGYAPALDMLSDDLRQALIKDCYSETLEVPKDWKMTDNALTDMMGGDVPVADDCRWPFCGVRFPHLYQGLLISNPRMMFLEFEWFPYPLAGMDVSAWMLMRYVTGGLAIPSAKEMKERNIAEALKQLQIPYIRYCVDRNYQDAYWKNAKKDPSYKDDKKLEYWEQAWYKSQPDYTRMYYRVAARMMQECKFPISYGTYDKVNDIVEKFLKSGDDGYKHRSTLDPNNEEENQWRTFRDVAHPENHCSVFTGTPSVPLKGKWMELNVNDENLLKPDC